MQIRSLITGAILLIIVGISSCRDDFEYDLASDELGFSTDTISLDTIFNHTNSQTYKFTVHNRQNKDVEIPRIYLSRGESSFYKINVDGMPGYSFENVPVRAKDSIFIFVEIAAGDAPVNPLYEDEVVFETTNGSQNVKLLSWIEKALFYNTEMTENFSLGNVDWNSEYSRVIYGNVTAENFNAGPGTRIYFHNNSSLTVNREMNVVGNKGNEVRFRSDRHDERSDSLPNMWNRILLKSHSDLNNVTAKIEYAIIKGGKVGLEVEQRKVEIFNTKILNNEEIGLYAKNANITGYNLVVNNSNFTAVAIEDGGTYNFTHCTFANYHNIGQGIGTNFSLYLSNETDNLLDAKFYNSIFYGRAFNAIEIEDGASGYIFKNNIIKGDLTFDSTNSSEDPKFVNPGFGTNDLRLKDGSSAINWGDSAYIGNATSDINQILRNNTSSPTAGAYEGFVTE